MFIDSHCHLNFIDLNDFDNQMEQLIQTAKQNGVGRMLCVCVELSDYSQLMQIANQFDDVDLSVGVHPNSIMEQEVTEDELISLAKEHPRCIAIGETGLDYYRTETDEARSIQRSRFRNHIRASIRSGKPLIIHTRQAAEDTLQIMKEENAKQIGGVMHCFGENYSVAKRAMDMGFYISFSGIVSFKNAKELHEVAQKLPLDRMLIETDSPYLAPVPYRGKLNHPALVKYVAEAISQLRQTTVEEIAQATTDNYYQCFKTD